MALNGLFIVIALIKPFFSYFIFEFHRHSFISSVSSQPFMSILFCCLAKMLLSSKVYQGVYLIHTDFQNLQKVKQIVLKVWKCLKIRPCLYVAQPSNLIQTNSIPKPPAVPNIFFVIFLTWTLTQARKARTLQNLNLERTVRLVSWTDRVVPCGYLRIGRETPLKVAVNRSGKLWF